LQQDYFLMISQSYIPNNKVLELHMRRKWLYLSQEGKNSKDAEEKAGVNKM